jgi:hypothetical protein
METQHGGSRSGNAIESARETLNALWSGMLAADKKSKAEGDGYFMTRQDELFVRQLDRCSCQHNTCGGCVALVDLLKQIAPLLPPESEITRRERRIARADAIEAERHAKETLSNAQRWYDAKRRGHHLPAKPALPRHYEEPPDEPPQLPHWQDKES